MYVVCLFRVDTAVKYRGGDRHSRRRKFPSATNITPIS